MWHGSYTPPEDSKKNLNHIERTMYIGKNAPHRIWKSQLWFLWENCSPKLRFSDSTVGLGTSLFNSNIQTASQILLSSSPTSGDRRGVDGCSVWFANLFGSWAKISKSAIPGTMNINMPIRVGCSVYQWWEKLLRIWNDFKRSTVSVRLPDFPMSALPLLSCFLASLFPVPLPISSPTLCCYLFLLLNPILCS